MKWWRFSKTYKIKCPGGHEAIVYKHVEDALPLAVKDSSIGADLSASVAELGSAKLAADHKSIANDLVFAIDSTNKSQIMDFRSAYLFYMANPCEHSDFLRETTLNIMEGRQRLEAQIINARTFLTALKNSPEDAVEILNNFGPLLNNFGVGASHFSGAAIAEAREDIKKLHENKK